MEKVKRFSTSGLTLLYSQEGDSDRGRRLREQKYEQSGGESSIISLTPCVSSETVCQQWGISHITLVINAVAKTNAVLNNLSELTYLKLLVTLLCFIRVNSLQS